MTGGLLGFLLFAVLVPLLVGEARDLAPSRARWLLQWGARRIGQPDQAKRYEEEWLADLEQVPGKMVMLVHAFGIVIKSVPRLRSQFRQGPCGVLSPGLITEITAERLAGASDVDAALRQVADVLVPRFADHCVIDLFHETGLIRRVQLNAGGWTPPRGAWAEVGDQVKYPKGHFCERAMTELDAVIVADLREHAHPAPTAESLVLARKIEPTSVLAAPLYCRGVLLGVLSLAISGLTDRIGHFDANDRSVITAVASQVAKAVDHKMPSGSCPGGQSSAGTQVTITNGKSCLTE